MQPATEPQKQIKVSAAQKRDLIARTENYYIAGCDAGCPQDQITNFLKAGIWLQPKQLEFCSKSRLCDSENEGSPTAIMYGGGRGSAKTHGVWAQVFADDCQRFPGLKCLILRKIGKANKEQVDDYITKLLHMLPHNFKRQEGIIHFDNGSRVRLGNFKDERDIDQYLGQEYDLIAISESNQLTFTKKKFMLTCLRTSKPGWRPRLYEDTNPGGVGMAENKKMYVEPWKQGLEKGTRYIHTTVYDNSFVNKEYIQQLESLQGWQRKAWLDGDWDWAAGSFFTSWREDVHVFPNGSVKLDEREIMRWFASMDYGYSHPNCFHLHCEDNFGRIFTMAEYHQNETRIQDHVDNFRDMLRLHHLTPEDLEFVAAGADCFKVDKDGATIASEYSLNGIELTRTQIDRVNAWAQMQERLGNVEKGFPPTWFIHHSCFYLIQQIPMAQYDPKKSGDIVKMNYDGENQSGGDDALECFIAGTKIRTEKGEADVEKLEIGDLVWTRQGLKPIWRTITKTLKGTITVLFSDGTKLTGTPEHPIWNGNDWQRLDSLRNGDNVSTWLNNPRKSYSTEGHLEDTQTQNIATYDAIIGRERLNPLVKVFHYIKQSGWNLMAQSQRVITFITRMRTPSITHSIIWSASSPLGTFQSMSEKDPFPNSGHKWNMLESSQQIGIAAQKERHWEKEYSRLASRLASKIEISSANSVEKNQSFTVPTISQNFVLLNAKRHKKEKREGTWKNAIASFVGLNSRQTNTPIPSLVPLRVVGSYSSGIETVYNLSIEDCHEYFANGVLVHNCARNGLVMAYSSILTHAKPMQMGNYQSLSDPHEQSEQIMRGEILLEQTYD